MADITITRLDNGSVDVGKLTYSGNIAYIIKDTPSGLIIRAIGGENVELLTTQSLNINGVDYAAGWNKDTIRGVLKTGAFFKAPSGGADLDIVPVVGNSIEHKNGTIYEWTLEGNDTLEITGVTEDVPAIGLIKVIQGDPGGYIPTLPGDDSDVKWKLAAGAVTIVGYLWDKEAFYFHSANAEGFSYGPLTKAFLTAVPGLSTDEKSRLNTFESVLDEVGKDKVLLFLPMRGGTAAAHKWNFMNPEDSDAAFRALFQGGGWVHSATGAKGDGAASYVDTNFNVGTNDDVPELSDLPDPRAFLSMYAAGLNGSAAGVDHAYMGCARSSFYVIQEAYNTSIDSAGGNAAAATGALPSRNGVISMHRKSSVMCQAFHNKVQMGADLSAAYSLTISVRTNVFLNAQNNAGVARFFSPNECRGYLMLDGNISDAQREKLVDALIAYNSDRPII